MNTQYFVLAEVSRPVYGHICPWTETLEIGVDAQLTGKFWMGDAMWLEVGHMAWVRRPVDNPRWSFWRAKEELVKAWVVRRYPETAFSWTTEFRCEP